MVTCCIERIKNLCVIIFYVKDMWIKIETVQQGAFFPKKRTQRIIINNKDSIFFLILLQICVCVDFIKRFKNI